jgi:hypothetical protein
MAEERLAAVLQAILLPRYLPLAPEWLREASGTERKGVKMIGAIYSHKGLKKFRAVAVPSAAPSARTTAQLLQRRALTTTYETEFTAPNQLRPLTAVLSRTRFGDLPCSQILTSVTIRFVESWLSLKDDDNLIEIVLETLRSMLAFFNSSKRPTTESKRQFIWNDPNKLMKPHRLDHLNTRSLLSRNASSGRPWVVPKPQVHEDVTIKANTFTAEDVKRRRDALAKGSGQVATWIVGPADTLSSYQNTYTTHFNKYKGVAAPELHTSVSVGRMIPNPDTLPRV